jgi:hypothetical protein
MVHTKEKLFSLGLVRGNATASKQLKVEENDYLIILFNS